MAFRSHGGWILITPRGRISKKRKAGLAGDDEDELDGSALEIDRQDVNATLTAIGFGPGHLHHRLGASVVEVSKRLQ